MTEIAVLTPDPEDSSYRGQWPGVLERLQAALTDVGVTTHPTPWVDHIEDAAGLKGFPLILPVLVWGYHRDHARFMQATRTWTDAGLPLANPASVLGWNSDKSYLGRLAERGVRIPRTIWTDGVTSEQVDAAFDELGAETLVVKPTVSGGAWRTLRLNRGDLLTDPPVGPAMIQPYLSSMETEGETSLLFFGGRFSHAVNKRPVPGDFRIQVQFGGSYETVVPPEDALAFAAKVLAAVDEPLLYARIDLARDAGGEWVLMEAELIEPDFYLKNDPRAGGGFGDAVRALLDRV
jgi:glutathione synthase/RimK-type ligase-like ATP-grasp enzyme